MTKSTKMKRKKPKFYETKSLSDTISSILFVVFIFVVFLLLFSYADSLSHARESIFRSRKRGYDDFAVKSYTWECQKGKCTRKVAHSNERISLETCNIMCFLPPVWPKPRNITITNKQSSVITEKNIKFEFANEGPAKILLKNATDLFLKNLELLRSGNSSPKGLKLTININLRLSDLTKLKLNTEETYRLSVQKQDQEILAYVSAQNFYGARHGLETLSQLIWFDEVTNNLKILHNVEIHDHPQFPYRGIMIDTARNFFPLTQIRKVVDGMAMSKLNVLHLHLTDAQSFPIILPTIKSLAEYGAYGPDMVYTPQDIKNLIDYSRVRGVRVILEIDAPSHVNAGWNYAKEELDEDYVICTEDVFNGHLNPDNNNVLDVLETIYGDLLKLTDDDEVFHIGSDEVNLDCWRKTEAAKHFNSMRDLWVNYTNRMLNKLKSANNNKLPENIIVWSSPLTESTTFKDIQGNITVQFWFGDPSHFLSKGHSVIYSTVGHWYLDCGFGPYKPSMKRGNCDPYTPWQNFYKYKPWLEFGHKEKMLGGEVCLWSEQVEVDSFQTRVWPRSAAFAERVWTDPDDFDDYDVYTRLVAFRERLVKSGIKNAAMWPRWCSQNPGRC